MRLATVWPLRMLRPVQGSAYMIGSVCCVIADDQVLLLQDLLFTVRQRLENAVVHTRLPPWPAAATATSRRATVFLARRFGRALRLLHSILAFDGFLPRRSAKPPNPCSLDSPALDRHSDSFLPFLVYLPTNAKLNITELS